MASKKNNLQSDCIYFKNDPAENFFFKITGNFPVEFPFEKDSASTANTFKFEKASRVKIYNLRL